MTPVDEYEDRIRQRSSSYGIAAYLIFVAVLGLIAEGASWLFWSGVFR